MADQMLSATQSDRRTIRTDQRNGVTRVYDAAGNVIEAHDIKAANALSNVLGKLVLQVRSAGSLVKNVMKGSLQVGRSLYSSFCVGNSKKSYIAQAELAASVPQRWRSSPSTSAGSPSV